MIVKKKKRCYSVVNMREFALRFIYARLNIQMTFSSIEYDNKVEMSFAFGIWNAIFAGDWKQTSHQN